MNAQRAPDTKPTAVSGSKVQPRKPWKKKTLAEVVFEQTDKLREQIAATEEELKRLRRDLQKLEEARKIFEVA